jgi:hypothetical protein
MDMPGDPGQLNLARLQTILSGRPSLINLLKTHQPTDINLSTLLEVLDQLKSGTVSDSDIK